MFDSSKFFNGLFGKIQPGMCRLTMNGNIAVKCSNGYKTYNIKKERLTNVSNFCFDIGSDFFFVIPTNKVTKGDIILVEGKPKCVIEVGKSIITVIDYESSEVRQVVPERHVFMGSSYFYGKIVSMLGGSLKGGKGLGNVMKMMMISQMMGGNNTPSNTLSPMGNMGNGMGQMMAMSMLMGGKDNLFGDMFGELSLDVTDDDDDDENESDNDNED